MTFIQLMRPLLPEHRSACYQTSLNGVLLESGHVGPIFSQLLNCWSEFVGVDIIGQIQKWDCDRIDSSDSDAPTSPTVSQR